VEPAEFESPTDDGVLFDFRFPLCVLHTLREERLCPDHECAVMKLYNGAYNYAVRPWAGNPCPWWARLMIDIQGMLDREEEGKLGNERSYD
jgi:hypothetical protein